MSVQSLRRIFLSYDYRRDAHRAVAVRAAWIAQGGVVHLETAKANSKSDIARWIDREIADASVTVVLVGSHTRHSKWVEYEIRQSELTGKGLIGVDVSGIRDQFGDRSTCDGELPIGYPFYNWIADNGERNLTQWVDQAVRSCGRLAGAVTSNDKVEEVIAL
ncbi:MAG: TIR domain-containing protein [Gammaproteobacteria bacterium]|nr:TIR domain-containing protein [Gammaproteobacteria bacterium]